MAPTSDYVPTNTDAKSQRPTKKRALTPNSQQSASVDALFANPDREIDIPTSKDLTTTGQPGANPPAIVTNVQGSSAGAGSGEFHVYKASRRREFERLRAMDEEVETEKADAEFEKRRQELRNKDEEQAAKNRAKREKAKARQMKKKKGGAQADGDADGKEGAIPVVKKLGAAKIVPRSAEGEYANGGDATVQGTGAEGEETGGITFHDDD